MEGFDSVEPTIEDSIVESDPASNPLHIKQAVDAKLLAELRDEMGFSELRAEKALYLTKNVDVGTAIQWLSDHEEDPDIDVPLTAGPRLTKEEADRKAVELQRRLRETRLKKEKEDELEKERKRIELAKNMMGTQRAIEEAERKRMIEQTQREKLFHEAEKQRQLDLLKAEYQERFGKPYPEEERKKEESDVSKKSGKDQVAYWVGRIRLRLCDDNKSAVLLCFKTLEAYTLNVYNNPRELKFQRIRKDNASFQSRIIPFAPEALALLDVVGFKDDGEGFLSIQGSPDKFLLGQAIKFIGLVLSQIS